MSRADSPRLGGDEGAVLVEFALVLPIIALVTLGILEFGLAWRDANTVTRTVASAGRTGATLANDEFTDYELLRAVQSGFTGNDQLEIERVIVYEAAAVDGGVPQTCLDFGVPTGTGAFGVADTCNIYSKDQVDSDSLAGFRRVASATYPDWDCASGSWDAQWCPADRQRARPGADYVGVFVEAEYTTVTGLISDEVHIQRSAVYEVDPPTAYDD